MPWKGEREPYRIWLSEVILQQTRVEQGWAYYEKFINAYPTIIHLAKAPETEVFKLWEGLGYYSRCRNLISTARHIADNFKGIFPSAYNEILLLKGVGPYTAAAISSFAYNEKRAVVDGNVQRVLSRYFGISTPIDTQEGKKLFSELAQSLIDEKTPALYNQAIMDFGATICKPRNPLCQQCIHSPECQAFQYGFIDKLPLKEKIFNRRNRWFYYFVLLVGDEVYIRKREQKDIWQNLHEFVLIERGEKHNDPATLLNELFKHHSYIMIYSGDEQKQQLTHQQIKGKFFVVKLKRPVELLNNYSLIRKDNLRNYAFPKFINTFLETYSI